MTESSIPVTVIGGYLGSGKTTFINACLSDGLRDAAIIVNDFGSINIDAALISAHHGDTLELTNGCVCCSVGQSLADTLLKILDRPQRPTQILIEASGVADPSSVAAYCHLRGLHLGGVLVLVDSLNAEATSRNELLAHTFARQVRAAHIIALTKSDLVDAKTDERVHHLVAALSHAPIVRASPTVLARTMNQDIVNTPEHADEPPHPTFTSDLVNFSGDATLDSLKDALAGLSPSVIRAKGVLQLADGSCVLVQKVGTHVSILPSTLSPTGLVTISA